MTNRVNGHLSGDDLRIERIRSPAALDAISAEWTAIADDMLPRTPFSYPTWNRVWWRHFAERRLVVSDEFFVHVARDRVGRLIAVFPMMLTRRPGTGPAAVRSIHFFGSDANVTEVRGVICRAEHEHAAVAALAKYLFAKPSKFDWFHCQGIRGDQSVWDLLTKGAPVRRERSVPDYYLEIPGSWDEFRSGLPRNIKESLRKCYNSLKRDGHAFSFRVVEKVEDASGAIHRFLELHRSRAETSGTIQHADVFGGQRPREFLLDIATEIAKEGNLRVFQLEIAGAVVATRIGFLLGDHLYLYFSGYDASWGKYSVMTTVVAESIKWAIDHQLKVVNLSPGSDVSKLRWSPKEISSRDGIVLSTTPRGRLAFRAYEFAREQPPHPLAASLFKLMKRSV